MQLIIWMSHHWCTYLLPNIQFAYKRFGLGLQMLTHMHFITVNWEQGMYMQMVQITDSQQQYSSIFAIGLIIHVNRGEAIMLV